MNKTNKFLKDLKEIRRDKYLYFLALPGILYFIIFKYLPMYGILIAFQDFSVFKGFSNSPWVGFEHFQRLFSEEDFWNLLRNTLAISFLNIVLFFPIPIILSLLLNELKNQVSRALR